MSYTNVYSKGYLIQSLYLSPKWSDITFVVSGEQLFAHKFVLVRKSIIFRKMLFGCFKERNEKEIHLKEMNLWSFKLLLKYCYFEDLLPSDWPSDEDNILLAIDVLKCAHLYQMKELSVICEMKLIGQMSSHNVRDVYNLGNFYKLKRIKFFSKLFLKQ